VPHRGVELRTGGQLPGRLVDEQLVAASGGEQVALGVRVLVAFADAAVADQGHARTVTQTGTSRYVDSGHGYRDTAFLDHCEQKGVTEHDRYRTPVEDVPAASEPLWGEASIVGHGRS